MYGIRIHSLDIGPKGQSSISPLTLPSGSGSTPAAASPSSSAVAANHKTNIIESRGIVHLYRKPIEPSISSSSDPFPLLPASRNTLLFVLAVPSSLSVEDLLRFYCGSHAENFLEVRVIRNDAIEDRYSVLIQVNDQKNADNFYLDLNGWRFRSAEEEVCHVLFVATADSTEDAEVASSPPLSGSTELPLCPVCLERLDPDISGIDTTGCDHSFHCPCISKWSSLSCPVCRYCQENSDKPTCSVCDTSENLWICMICGFVGCGRYREGHAIKHWKSTQHCYSLDFESQRVWDYVGDTYVHRLNPSKSDGKAVKTKHRCRASEGRCEVCDFNEDSGVSGAIYNSKVTSILDEYNHLLTSQLDAQRQYYESLIADSSSNREKLVSEAVENALSTKLQTLQIDLEKATNEMKLIKQMNEKLILSQKQWREKVQEIEERERSTLHMMDAKIHDLEEEVRDFTVYVQAQKAVNDAPDADDIREGTVLSVPQQNQQSSSSSKRRSKTGRRRK